MMRQMLKLIWNRKRSNAFLIMELFFTFLVLDAILAAGFLAWQRYHLPNGFSVENVLNITGRETGVRRGDANRGKVLVQAANALKSMNEVREVGLIQWSLYENSKSMLGHRINGVNTMLYNTQMTDTCKDILNIELIRGRWFAPADEDGANQPVVITQNLADKLFGDDNPLGKTFNEFRVVGVMPAFRIYGEFEEPQLFMIRRAALGDSTQSMKSPLLVKLKSPSTAELEARILATLQSIAPTWTFDISRAGDLHAAKLKTQAAPYVLAGMASSMLVLMVVLGLLGVLWQNITRRTKEIGLRRANGATVNHIFTQIIGEMLLLATAGILPGILIIVQLLFLDTFGYISHTIHIYAMLAAAGLLYGIVALCSLYPGYMATRISPSAALHYE